jgi:hypothetical protein
MGDYRALMISLKRYLDVSRGRGGPPLCVRSRRLSRMTREHDGQHGCTQNRVEQRIHAKISDTAITSSKRVRKDAHAPVPLRAPNLVVRDMENR